MGKGGLSMGTVMRRENERGRLTVPGCRTDDGGWRSLVVVREVMGGAR